MENFIFNYYIEPILSRTGYNPINTISYAILALISLYVIYRLFKKYDITIDKKFIFSVIPFVLLGSTVRVVTDAIDAGKFLPITPIHKAILDSHIYDYGFLTASPGIYIVIAFVLFASMIALRRIKKPELLGQIGLALWVPHFLLLLPFFKFWIFAFGVATLATIPAFIVWKLWKNEIYALMVGAQLLDGAATFLILDFGEKILGVKYFEQHVVSSGLCNIFNTCTTFYVAKLAISVAAAYLLVKEKDSSENERYFIALVILIMGLAPGLRDVLRVLAGT